MVVVADMTLRQLTDDYEIIVVDDASPDHGAAILQELQTRYPRLRVVRHPENRGYGGALRSGFSAATKELVFYTDGDAQYDARELALLYHSLTDGVDVVQGFKIARHDPLHRLVIGRIYHHVVSLAFGLKMRDVDCDFRLIRSSLLKHVQLTHDSGVICVELMKKLQLAGARVTEVPVHHYYRAYGQSQFFNVPRVAHTLVALAGLWIQLVLRGPHRQPAVGPAATETSPRPAADLEPRPR